ncbi:MAG: DUF2200 domain-containing protein [Actinomycetota bacterium]
MSFEAIYTAYVAKAEKKGRTKREVDRIIRWMTGYDQRRLTAHVRKETTVERFVAEAPALNPGRALITGVVCGVRVEDVEHPLMREVRFLDKLVDELARGKPMETILRSPTGD